MATRRRPATDRDDVAAFAETSGDRVPQGAVAEDRDRGHVLLLVIDEEPPVVEAGNQEAAVTRWCPRPLEPPCPEAPVGRSLRAPSEPQGPCLPAGPPELLLGLVGHEDAAHVHILHADRSVCKAARGCVSVAISSGSGR